MKSLNEILAQYIQRIGKFVGNSVKIFTEFTGERMEYPIKRFHISIGIYNLKVYCIEDQNGNLQEVKELTIEATICAPKTAVGADIVNVVDGVVNASLADGMPSIVEIQTGKASYNSSIGAILQSVFITIKV